MAVDRVQPLKIESPESGGTQHDEFPTSVNRNEDYLDCRGLALQDETSDDETTLVHRSGDNMLFQDKANPSGYTLTQLSASASGIGLGFAIFTTSGGLVYDTSGHTVVKAAP